VLEIIKLFHQGQLSAEECIDRIESALKCRPQLEQLAIEMGFLNMKQMRRLLQLQEQSHLSFERLAIREGFLTEQQIGLIMLEQHTRTMAQLHYGQVHTTATCMSAIPTMNLGGESRAPALAR
jgi:hypothetical protein